VAANDYVPYDAELEAFRVAKSNYGQTPAQYNRLNAYVDGLDGLTEPSSDDLIQWAAANWGIPTQWLRAQYAQESYWRQSTLGDRASVPSSWVSLYPPQARINTSEVYESMGIAQVKWKPDGSQNPGTEPLRWKSSAFNLDYQAAQLRYYFDGLCSWCGSGDSAGQEWASIGAWFSPNPWNNSAALAYVKEVQALLAAKPWLSSSF
jgi:hypothetical protein